MSKKELTTPAAETVNTGLVDTVDALVAKMNEVREAQRIFATYTPVSYTHLYYCNILNRFYQYLSQKQ